MIQGGFYITYLNGGAYEYGTAFTASFMGNYRMAPTSAQRQAAALPGTAVGTLRQSQPQQIPFSPSIGNAAVIFDFPYNKDNMFPQLPNARSVGTAPYDQAWSIGVQRELPWDMFMTASYVGNRAIHLPTTLELSNQPNPSVLQYGSLLGKNILDPDVVAAGFTPPYPNFVDDFGGAAILEQALTPYPMFAGYFPVNEMDGTAFYNAFQLQAEKRFKGDLSYIAGLTLSPSHGETASVQVRTPLTE